MASEQAPPHRPPRTVTLIGGPGRMGRVFAPLFAAEGCRVLSVDDSPDPGYDGAVAAADLVLVTVPIDATVPVIRRIAPFLRPGQLLSDLTSVKREPVQAMLETPADVIGCHPLFGPSAGVEGQNAVLCPARPGGWMPWYRAFLARHGLQVVKMSPEAHDEAMAFIQGLTHFINITFARTLRSREADLEGILQVCSPVYRVLFAMLCRILSGEAELYGQIQLANPRNAEVLRDFLANGEAFADQVETGDAEGVYRAFTEAAEYLGDYREVARRESDELIRCMREQALDADES